MRAPSRAFPLFRMSASTGFAPRLRPFDPDAALRLWALPVLLLAWWTAQRLDAPLARLLFEWQGGHWALRQHVLVEDVVHRGGRALSLLAWLALGVATLRCWRRVPAQAWTRPAARLLLATLASTLAVAWLKSATHVDCPWDLAAYGGDRPFVGLFDARLRAPAHAACFPAAHAASGYAWVALYFFFADVRPRWRWAGLGAGLLAGLAFGIAQQLRGAHFLSHDIASLIVCWTLAAGVDAFPRRRQLRGAAA